MTDTTNKGGVSAFAPKDDEDNSSGTQFVAALAWKATTT